MSGSNPCALIISDLHLSANCPETVRLFKHFIHNVAAKAQELYIIGDFFEFWIGDDDKSDFHQDIIDTLSALDEHGTKLYLMHGNRDFMLGKRFCQASKATLLPDPSVVNIYGTNYLLTHGDLLCTKDIKYQRYRKVVNQRWVQWLFLRLPLGTRRRIAQKLRSSGPGDQQPPRPINQGHPQDADRQAVLSFFDRYHVSYIIHGHTHRYAIHYHFDNRQRIVLGDWHDYGSYIKINQDAIALCHIELPAPHQPISRGTHNET